ncbi:hypothetical protein Rsub_04674 [Raphidocelis subcapitata]|uniref:Uncharacterized protein n=1 Tax=Raphidocelis subcapitata TaxID=307507 RepID=A0A2V0P280_9CHLO|nr:hypothetical protein Rsub_04674 [Raphidocelis subcapitata]|eukprot:GBF91950.1 hypothetical protein Rsub_04674 [Raphidocelis subcapitata]
MPTRLVIRLAVLAALVAAAAAQPCIECKDCRTDNCYRNCKNSCPQNNGGGPIRPSDITVNGDACRNQGNNYGPNAARSACETTRKYCQGGRSMGAPRMGGVGPTNLAQCANIAMGACQGNANNPWSWGHPCGNDLRNGYQSCNQQTFKNFFEGETSDLCRNFAKGVTGVNPGTNQFMNPILNLFGRRLLRA